MVSIDWNIDFQQNWTISFGFQLMQMRQLVRKIADINPLINEESFSEKEARWLARSDFRSKGRWFEPDCCRRVVSLAPARKHTVPFTFLVL